MSTATVDFTSLAVDELVRDHPTPSLAREKAERYVAEGKCYCCGSSANSYEGDPIQRCFVCWGRGHGDDVLP